MAHELETRTGIPFIHLEIGSPGLPPNKYGIEAEKEALDMGIGAAYPPYGGIRESREAVAEFVKAFVDVDIDPRCCVLTSGTMQGSLVSFIALTQYKRGRDKILFLDPCFASQKQQLNMIGAKYRCFDISGYRAGALKARLEQEFEHGDIAAVIYSNPNNPSWMCLTDSELKGMAELCEKYDVVPIEDMAYFCMDYRRDGLGHPYRAPFPPSIARYASKYILLLSASKIFSYAGQRIAAMCISEALFDTKSSELASRYDNLGLFGVTVCGPIVDLMTCGPAMTCQWAYGRMLRLCCEGKIDFLEDISVYSRMSARMKEIFLRHGFHIVYDSDVEEQIGDGFFFTLGYKDMTSGELAAKLMEYGVSAVNLKASGAVREGVRICSSRIKEEQLAILDERMTMFENEMNNL